MTRSSPDILVPFLLGAQDEILDLIGKKYGDRAAREITEESGLHRTDFTRFARVLARYSRDPEIKAVIDRKYRECGRILGIVSGAHSKTRDFFEVLDAKSRSILVALNERGHATLDELSAAAHSTHYEVLHRLREVINPESERRFGKPFVTFRESNIDPLTGEKILFSWWLDEESSCESGILEVTEYDEAVIITAELAGSDLPRRMWASATFNHGILEVHVAKRGKSDGRQPKGT